MRIIASLTTVQDYLHGLLSRVYLGMMKVSRQVVFANFHATDELFV